MTHVLKATALAALLVGGAIHAQAPTQAAAVGGNAIVTEQRPVGAIAAIDVSVPWHVVIQAAGDKPSLQVSGERKTLDEIETVMRGDTLVVRSKTHFGFHMVLDFDRHGPVTVRISAPALAKLHMGGSGAVDLDGVHGEAFSLANDGAGRLRAGGAVRRLAVAANGSGALDLRGLTSADADVAVDGPGAVDLGAVSHALAARADGSGALQLRELRGQSARVRMSGPGAVLLAGSVAELDAQIDGSGRLDADGLQVRTASIKSHGPGGVALAGVADTLDAELHGSGGLHASLRNGKRLRLDIDGPGGARIDGKVELLTARLDGSGSLQARELQAGRADINVSGPGRAAVRVADAGHPQLLEVDRRGSRRSDQ